VGIGRIKVMQGEEKIWWSQRDLNPCLSLERTDETEEKQQDDDSEVSDE
jgi:hypothetical protein